MFNGYAGVILVCPTAMEAAEDVDSANPLLRANGDPMFEVEFDVYVLSAQIDAINQTS